MVFAFTRVRKLAAALGLALLMAACTQETVLLNLSMREANDIIVLLAERGVSASRVVGAEGTYGISVASEDQLRALAILSATGYPQEDYQSLAQVFPGEGLIVSPFEHRARFMFALSQELTRSITSIEGVVSARVHVAMPEYELRGLRNQRPSSSVVVRHRADIDPTLLAPQIRLMVANAVQNLAYDDVSVAFFEVDTPAPARMMPASMAPEPADTPSTASPFAGTAPAIDDTTEMTGREPPPAEMSENFQVPAPAPANSAEPMTAMVATDERSALVWTLRPDALLWAIALVLGVTGVMMLRGNQKRSRA